MGDLKISSGLKIVKAVAVGLDAFQMQNVISL